MKTGIMTVWIALLIAALAGCGTPDLASTLRNKPYQGKMPEIPGKLSCILFDEGGEGIAYHDRETTNLAAVCCGGVFRTNEGVDIGVIANHHQDLNGTLDPKLNYIGWVFEGEWLKYTVSVKESGVYQVTAHMSSGNTNCVTRLSVDGGSGSVAFSVPRATGDVHVWDVYTNLAQIHLKKGTQVLKLKMLKGQRGDQNYDYLEFVRK